MAQTLGTLLINVESNTTQLIQGFNRAESVVNKTTKQMTTAIKTLAGAYVSLEAVDLAKSYAKQVDALTNVNNRLKLVTKSTQELVNAQNEIYKISQLTSSSYSNTADLFSRVALSTKSLSLSQKDLLGITETINKAMILSGGTAESMNAAIIQLGQAFQADFKAVGQELGSLREQAPRLYQAIVDGSGYAADSFKKAAEDGKLSSEIIINAIKKQVATVNSEYGLFTKTIEQAMVNASNSTQKFIGEFDKLTGISKGVSESILSISNSIDSLSAEEIANLTEYIKNAGIAIATSVIALKTGKIAYEVYTSSVEKSNKINQLNIDIENSKAKAYSDGMKAVHARKIADEALNTGILNGVELSKKQVNQLQKEATQLENVAKKQVAYSYSLESTARGFNLATTGANLLKGALATIPFMAISIGISAIATSLLSASKASETLEKTLSSTGEELKELTKNQLSYRQELVKTAIQEQALETFKAKLRAESNGIFDTEKDKKEQLAYYDEQKKKLTDLKFVYEDITDALNDFNRKTGTKTETNTAFDRKGIDDLITKTLNPYQSKLDEINKTWQTQFDLLVKNGQDTSKLVQAWQSEIQKLDKETADNKIKENEKANKDHQKLLEDRQSQYLNYYEKIGDYSNLWNEEEKKLREDNSKLTAIELENLLAVEKINFEKRHNLQKEFLTSDEWQEYYIKIGEYDNAWLIYQGENYEKWKTLAGEKLPEVLEIYKKEFFDKIDKENKAFEFDIDLDSFDTPITNAVRAMDKLNESTEKYNKYIKQSGLTKEDIAKADEKNLSNQLKGYSNIAGAIGGLFKDGSREAATFQVAQSALALVEGTRAILTAGTGDPYTAIPRMIAMGAMVSSLLGNIGVAFGMNKSSTSSDSFSSMAANTGTGSALGDSKKASESITNALNVLEDFAEPQFQTLVSMNAYLKTIASSIGGVTSLLIQSGGFAFGSGYQGFDTGFKNNLALNDITLGLMNPINAILSKIPVIGQLNGLFGGIVNSVLGGLFGKTSVSQSMTDSGIFFANQLLTNAIEDFNGSAYQTIATTVTKKSWFSKSSSTTINSYFEALDNETERQFSLVLGNLYDTVLTVGNALDSTSEQTAKSLENFVVSIGKISLKGKTGDQIQETLTNVFGRIGDDIAKTAFPLLTPFQKVGEGMFETLTRVATGMEEADYYISRLGNRFNDVVYTMIGNKQGDVGFEALLQSIERVENATYPTNNGLLDIIENLDLTAEELYNVYTNLDELRDRLIFLGQESQGLSNSMIYGAGSVSELDNGFKAFFDNFLTENEQLTYQTQQLIEQFNNLGISIPISKDGFKELLSSIDLTTESGQELYGRLIILSEGFAEVADKTAESITKLQNELDTLNNTAIENFKTNIQSIINTVDGLRDIAKSFLDSFANREGNVRNQIIQYNKLRKEFESFFEGGALKAGVNDSQIKDLYSQLSTIGKSLGQSQESLVNDLTTQFENDLSRLDLSNEILKVAIVDGVGELANETTLSSLNEFTKKQLEVLQKTQEQETASLSSKTFTYGDYIGKQEQIDIAKMLGISYETAKPLVESLQNLSVSKNLQSDLEKILGYSEGGITYDISKASQIANLGDYLNPNVTESINSIKNQVSTNIETKRIEDEDKKRLNTLIATYQSYLNDAIPNSNIPGQTNDSLWESIILSFWNSHVSRYGIGWNTSMTSDSERAANMAAMQNTYRSAEFNMYQPMLNQLLEEKAIKGYAVGAVNIPQDQIAQIHRGEMIIPSTFSEGLRNGDLTLSGRMPNLDNFSILNGISEMIGNLVYNIGEYPKKTYDILDDVINGRNSMRVQQI